MHPDSYGHTFVSLLLKSSDPRLIFITSGMSTLAESENASIKLNQSPAKGWPIKTCRSSIPIQQDWHEHDDARVDPDSTVPKFGGFLRDS
ncbi:hypothetical protein V1517DRAFT_329154 [Lipomyces orientalis]|uniref:Uncharacterized protein n=1 Tax=Lipomyces orientalis TaxID=1233043 RepID=A0ACC3TK97_9ASCO